MSTMYMTKTKQLQMKSLEKQAGTKIINFRETKNSAFDIK